MRLAQAMKELDPAFDIRAAFNQDYLDFYETLLTPERTALDAATALLLLNLEPGRHVLDLACGHGRIANLLAKQGLSVTGLDITPMFLDLARRDAAAQGLGTSFVRGDMRALPFTDGFDAVVNWFTAFGYFDDAGNRQTLREIHRVLKPGGVFLVDLNNRDSVLPRFRSETVAVRDGDYLFDLCEYDALTGCVNTERVIVRGGVRRSIHYSIRMFAYTELRDWLYQAGFSEVTGFGDYGTPFTRASRRMIVWARK